MMPFSIFPSAPALDLTGLRRIGAAAVALGLAWPGCAAWAQHSPQQTASPSVAQQQPSQWQQLPRMQLERQYAGPLQDTLIQRWRDPVDGTTCYLYLPVSVQHSPPMATGFVQYGANTIGSISCMPGPAPANGHTPGHK
jgi:hypothetical protein